MTKKWEVDMQMQGQGIIVSLSDLMTNITKARYRQSQAKMAFEKAQDRLETATRDGTMGMLGDAEAAGLEFDSEQMQQWWIQTNLEKDEAWVAAYTEFSTLQEELYNAQVSLIDLSERLGTTKAQSRLLAAMCTLLSEDADGE